MHRQIFWHIGMIIAILLNIKVDHSPMVARLRVSFLSRRFFLHVGLCMHTLNTPAHMVLATLEGNETMKTLDKGVSGAARTTIDPKAKTVAATFGTRRGKVQDTEGVEVSCTINFADCTTADLINLATKTVIVEMQRRARASEKMEAVLGDYEEKGFNVKSDWLDVMRSGPDPVAKARKVFEKSGLSKAELRAMIDEMED